MFGQIAGRGVDLIKFLCDGMFLQLSEMETEDGNHSFATQVKAHKYILLHEVAKCRNRTHFFRVELN
jgi:hypothetical protein